jgi:hypothetical protein
MLSVPSTLFVFNQTAVRITMTVIYLPFAILPIFLSLERIPASLVAASADLGGPPGYTFRHVVLPLSLPGTIVGGLFVMVLALGDFLTPQMVGGSQGFTFGRAIWSQFGMAFDWPFGAALAVMLLLAIVAILTVAGLLNRRRKQVGGRFVLTVGILSKPGETVQAILQAIAEFNDFTADNDPWGEHDCGSVSVHDVDVLWKIDYYDLSLLAHSSSGHHPSDDDHVGRGVLKCQRVDRCRRASHFSRATSTAFVASTP